uniref:Putative group v salivary lipocalin n=1 Tax=Rhipicephalus pulchellus TaxID=72859 RepID=L7MBW2_RHIPC
MHALLGILIIVATSLCPNVNSESSVSVVANDTRPIVKVFDTCERIWQYQVNSTTEEVRDTCISLTMINITKDDYYFWRNETYRRNVGMRDKCHGIFKNGTRKEALGAIDVWCAEDDEVEEEMELIYTEQYCSIFYVTSPFLRSFQPSKGAACRMYILDDAVDGGPTQTCTGNFSNYCPGNKAVYYNKTCKTG